MTVREAALEVGVHRSTIYRWIKSGKLAASRNQKGRWDVTERAARSTLNQQQQAKMQRHRTAETRKAQKENKSIIALLKKSGKKPLTGSEKRIAYGQSIREKYVKDEQKRLRSEVPQDGFEQQKYLRRIRRFRDNLSHHDAKWWIDNRGGLTSGL